MMKKRIILFFTVAMMGILTACGNSQDSAETSDTSETTEAATEAPTEAEQSTHENSTDNQSQSGGSALVAYFAYSENIGDTSSMSVDAISSASLNESTDNVEGNLQIMAQEIKEKKGADVHHIIVEEPYDPDYSTMLDRADEEHKDDARPALASQIDNLEQYDVVYLGMPVWFGDQPQAMLTFFEENDLSGKTIVPFGIHLGSQFGSMISQIEEAYPDATVVDGFTVSADTANEEVKVDFGTWLDELNLE